jgi:hypothetical protein
MKGKRNYINKCLIFLMICVLILSSIPVVLSKTQNLNFENVKDNYCELSSGSFYFTDCLIVITGNVNNVYGPLVWIFGVYCPLLKRSFRVLANNEEGESLNVIVFGKGVQFGSYLDQEHILVSINSARGFLYWSGKAISNPGNKISLVCRASNVYVITYE